MPIPRPPRSKPGAYRPRSPARKPPARADAEYAPTSKRRKTPAPPEPLTAAQKRYLRGVAHDLKPVILIGQKGVSDAVVAELDGALAHHELVKLRLADDDRDARAAALMSIAARVGAEVVQSIGKVGCLYRLNPDKAQFGAMPGARRNPSASARPAR